MAGFQWASKVRAQCKENMCGVCLHVRADNTQSHLMPGAASMLGTDLLRQLPEPNFQIQSPQKDRHL